jgi:hypothetical protein
MEEKLLHIKVSSIMYLCVFDCIKVRVCLLFYMIKCKQIKISGLVDLCVFEYVYACLCFFVYDNGEEYQGE